MSLFRALKLIMKWSEKEIKENFEEIRLEKALAAELEKTAQIIKKTGIFDTVDRIYGEPGAEYMDDQQGGQGGLDASGGGTMGGGAPPPMDSGGDLGGDLDGLGAPGAEDSGDINGQEGSMPTADRSGNPNAPMESLSSDGKKLIIERNELVGALLDRVMGKVQEDKKETSFKRADIYDSSLLVNEEFDKMISQLSKFVEEK